MKTDNSSERSDSDRINKMESEKSGISNSDPSKSALSAVLPHSKKVYVAGQIHLQILVPFREISLAPTKTMSCESEVNEPVRVYDKSGPWGDSSFDGYVDQRLHS